MFSFNILLLLLNGFDFLPVSINIHLKNVNVFYFIMFKTIIIFIVIISSSSSGSSGSRIVPLQY